MTTAHWICKNGEVFFMTDSDLDSELGIKLNKCLAENPPRTTSFGDNASHLIDGIPTTGKHCCCSDFSDPNNLPEQLVKAIKEGKRQRFGVCLEILSQAGQNIFRVECETDPELKKIKLDIAIAYVWRADADHTMKTLHQAMTDLRTNRKIDTSNLDRATLAKTQAEKVRRVAEANWRCAEQDVLNLSHKTDNINLIAEFPQALIKLNETKLTYDKACDCYAREKCRFDYEEAQYHNDDSQWYSKNTEWNKLADDNEQARICYRNNSREIEKLFNAALKIEQKIFWKIAMNAKNRKPDWR